MMKSKVCFRLFALGANGDVYPEQMKEACSLMEAKAHLAERGSIDISRQTASRENVRKENKKAKTESENNEDKTEQE